jgi:NADH-quinone oxidoreductase subunit A
MNDLYDFLYILVFIVVAVLFAAFPLILARLIAPHSSGAKRLDIYECGIGPFGSAWIRYGVYYYIYAIIFIAFDVDVLYLFPVALSYTKGSNISEYYSLLLFVLILAFAIIYAWRKGVFSWKRRIQS